MIERLQIIGGVLRRPVSAYNELKYRRYTDRWLVLVILGLWFLIRILKRQFYGFRFNTQDTNDFSLLIQLATTVLPFLLFMIANWAVCALMDGEGRFGEITTFMSIALVPYLIFQLVAIGLSNVMVLSEGVFLTSFVGVGILWSLLLFFQGQRIVHNYSSGKTLGAILLSVCGVAIIFVETVYSEIMFRK